MAGKPRNEISPKQLQWVKHFIETNNGRKAAILAGYSEPNAQKASGILKKNPLVIAELEKHRKQQIAEGVYGKEKAMREIDMRIQRADEAGQHNAVATLMTLKAKVDGLLIERHDVRTAASFQIVIKGVFDPSIEVAPTPQIKTIEGKKDEPNSKVD